jgi:hypothetical protein
VKSAVDETKPPMNLARLQSPQHDSPFFVTQPDSHLTYLLNLGLRFASQKVIPISRYIVVVPREPVGPGGSIARAHGHPSVATALVFAVIQRLLHARVAISGTARRTPGCRPRATRSPPC